MKKIKCVFRIALQNISSWGQNYRIIMLTLLIIVNSYQICSRLVEYSAQTGYALNLLGVFPIMYCNSYSRMIIQLGIILMYSNAPFKCGNSQFVVMRTGYAKWCVGQVIYITFSSLIYVAFVFLTTVIFTLGHFELNLKWGKAFTGMTVGSKPVDFDENLIRLYKPLDALLNTVILLFLLSLIFGFLIFLMSSVWGKASGLIAASALVLLGRVRVFLFSVSSIVKFSPCSLTEFWIFDNHGITRYASARYAYTALGVITAFLLTACVFIYANKKIRHNIYNAEV